ARDDLRDRVAPAAPRRGRSRLATGKAAAPARRLLRFMGSSYSFVIRISLSCPTRRAGACRHPRLVFVRQAKSWMPACASLTGESTCVPSIASTVSEQQLQRQPRGGERPEEIRLRLRQRRQFPTPGADRADLAV